MLQQTPKPKIIHGEQILVKVGATGLCHSDLHLVNGDEEKHPLQLPKIPGHENAGWIEEIGDSVQERRIVTERRHGFRLRRLGMWNLYSMQEWK